MKNSCRILALALLISASPTFGAETGPTATQPSVASAPDAKWLAAARASYPLKTCVVSGEELLGDNEMGGPKDYVYSQEGKPDRLIRFCCAKCQTKFDKDPAKYLKLIDEAAAKAAKH